VVRQRRIGQAPFRQHSAHHRSGVLEACERILQRLGVAQDELCVDNIYIARRVHGAWRDQPAIAARPGGDQAGRLVGLRYVAQQCRTFDVGHVNVVEAADAVDDGVHLADVLQELVAEACVLARASADSCAADAASALDRFAPTALPRRWGCSVPNEARNVHEAQLGVDHPLCPDVAVDDPESRVRHQHAADVGLDPKAGRQHALRAYSG